MGYNTRFDGVLKFVSEPTAAQLAKLNSMFGEDIRDHQDWLHLAPDASYIDLVLAKDFSGIQWDDGTEKTYGLVNCVNLVTSVMRETWPDFRLAGSLLAQGEELTDRWRLAIDDDGLATKQEIQIAGTKVTCPHCEESFFVET